MPAGHVGLHRNEEIKDTVQTLPTEIQLKGSSSLPTLSLAGGLPMVIGMLCHAGGPGNGPGVLILLVLRLSNWKMEVSKAPFPSSSHYKYNIMINGNNLPLLFQFASCI